jgi:hypothetical protein
LGLLQRQQHPAGGQLHLNSRARAIKTSSQVDFIPLLLPKKKRNIASKMRTILIGLVVVLGLSAWTAEAQDMYCGEQNCYDRKMSKLLGFFRGAIHQCLRIILNLDS